MCFLQSFLNCEMVRSVISNDFKCGYVAATAVFLLILLLVMVLKLICFFAFRHQKCSEVVVKTPAGDLVISSKVVSSMIGRLLAAGKRFDDAKVTIRKYGANYRLYIRVSYVEGAQGLPVLLEDIQPQITDLLKQQFGIENVESVTFMVDRLTEPEESDADTGF